MNETHRPQEMLPGSVRYIKLGERGTWLDDCLDQGRLQFSDLVPHAVASAGDWDRARELYVAAGRGNIANDLRELREFYQQPKDCLWITFGKGRLWWAFVEAEVRDEGDGLRSRKVIEPWSCRDAAGAELLIQDLSTSLTRTASYRRTICGVAAEAYLLRRLNAAPDGLSERLQGAQGAVRALVEEMIADLHQADLERLVDLIFAGSGWRRISAVGGAQQADTDLVLQQAATGERAFVQVKSRANAATLRDYMARFEAYPGMDRFFFACHTPTSRLQLPDDGRMQLWLRPQLAAQAVRAGLVDWLLATRR